MSVVGARLRVPRLDGRLTEHVLREPRPFLRPSTQLRSRVFLAAAHVVADPLVEPDGSGRAKLDWEATLAFRHHLWSWGLGVAEAMDTAQRGMGLDWATSRELISVTGAAARAAGAPLAAGAGTDQLPEGRSALGAIVDAYLEQCEHVESVGAQAIVMASRALAGSARGPDDYSYVYGHVLPRLRRPAILHWLGDMFDPALAGYWGTQDLAAAADFVVALVREHAVHIDGIKVSLLDAERERFLRERLPAGVRLYTGDDFDYPGLIRGDATGASDALLGVFDPIAPAASAALQALDAGDVAGFDDAFAYTVPLARHLFSAPTSSYKTGIVFLAWLNGHQSHFRMVGGMESARSIAHLGETFVLADRAGLLADPELASARFRRLLAVAGQDT